jgi:rod shape-determining protein MreD
MTRLLLRLSNAPAILLIAMCGVALQTSLFSFWILNYFQPDILLLLVIWCAIRRSFLEGGILTLMIGEIAEVHSAAPSGMFMIGYMATYLSIRGAARLLSVSDLNFLRLLTLFASVLDKVIMMGVFWLLGGSKLQVAHMIVFVFPTAVVNGLLGQYFYLWLQKLDWVTLKNTRVERLLDNDVINEQQLEYR